MATAPSGMTVKGLHPGWISVLAVGIVVLALLAFRMFSAPPETPPPSPAPAGIRPSEPISASPGPSPVRDEEASPARKTAAEVAVPETQPYYHAKPRVRAGEREPAIDPTHEVRIRAGKLEDDGAEAIVTDVMWLGEVDKPYVATVKFERSTEDEFTRHEMRFGLVGGRWVLEEYIIQPLPDAAHPNDGVRLGPDDSRWKAMERLLNARIDQPSVRSGR